MFVGEEMMDPREIIDYWYGCWTRCVGLIQEAHPDWREYFCRGNDPAVQLVDWVETKMRERSAFQVLELFRSEFKVRK